jgi:large subunit ribosomal protein L22
VDEALSILRFVSAPKAQMLARAIKSAAANAENNFQMPSELKIVRIFVDEGQVVKRYYPRARGRAGPVLNRYSHITVVVAEEEEKVGA